MSTSCIVGSSYIRDGTQQKIVLCLRDSDGKKSLKFFPYSPYFYIRKVDKDIFDQQIKPISSEVVSIDQKYKGFDGYDLLKVTMSDPKYVGMINRIPDIVSLYESNILFHYRYMIDKGLKTGIDENENPVEVESRHRFVFIDIEVDLDRGPDSALYPVLVIGLYDLQTKEYHSIFTGKDFPVNMEVILSDPKVLKRYSCSNEEQLIEVFAQLWLQLGPDAVISFSPFDMYYLCYRMKMLGIDPSFLSPIYSVIYSTKTKDIRIGGVAIVDYAELYRKVFGEPIWNTLDYISNKELGYGKLKIESVVKQWREDYKKVVEYNLRDVELLKDLEAKLGLIRDYLLFIWKTTGLDLEDCLKPYRMGDILHLRKIKGKCILRNIPLETFFHSYKGALVIFEKPDLFSNVAVFDWNELYPTIMETFHISLDTLDPYGNVRISPEASFSSSKPGWTNELLLPLREGRKEIKRLAKETIEPSERRRYKMLSEAIKAIINAAYGIYGQKTKYFTSRFYDQRIASSITYIGREMLVEAQKILQEIGYTLLYGDTDSLFVQLKEKDPEEIDSLKEEIQSKINLFISNKYHIEGNFRLDLEYVFRKVLLLTKKRYHGETTSGETIIKGIFVIRKDTAKITVKEEEKVGKLRLEGKSREEVEKYVDDLYLKVSTGQVPIEDIAVMGKCAQSSYSRTTRNEKAIKYSKQLGINVNYGDRFFWLYIFPKTFVDGIWDGVKKIYPANVIAFNTPSEIPSNLAIDYKRMADFTIKNPLAKYIEKERVIKNHSLLEYLEK